MDLSLLIMWHICLKVALSDKFKFCLKVWRKSCSEALNNKLHMINHRYWHPMKKPLQVHLYMHFPVSVFIQFWDTHWNISIGKAVPCNFLCLSFLLELFLYTLCDYIGKTVDILATVWLNVCIWFLTFQSVISSSHVKELTSLLDTFYWYWWSSPLCW